MLLIQAIQRSGKKYVLTDMGQHDTLKQVVVQKIELSRGTETGECNRW